MHIKQPNDYTCGQSSVAMLSKESIEFVISKYGHDKTSDMTEAREVLTGLGYNVGELVIVDNRKKWELPNMNCMIRLEIQGRTIGHFVAQIDGKIYDPSNDVYESLEELLKDYNKRLKRLGYGKRKWVVRHYMTVS